MERVHGYFLEAQMMFGPNRHEELSDDVESVLYPDEETAEVDLWVEENTEEVSEELSEWGDF